MSKQNGPNVGEAQSTVNHETKNNEHIDGSYIKIDERSNPHHYPKRFLMNGLSMAGTRLCSFGYADAESMISKAHKVRSFEVREDDVLVAAFPKNGTHWLWEVVHMLVHNTTTYDRRKKEFSMLEYCDLEDLDIEPSPRVLNSHLVPHHLPRQIVEKKMKIVLVARNYKDALVSYYHHYNAIAEEGFNLDGHLQAFMNNDQLHWPNQFEYLRKMHEFSKEHPDHPVRIVYYENMKKNPLTEIRKLAEFLEVHHSEKFLQDVIEACSFENMKVANKTKEAPKFIERLAKGVDMYRKGIIGDWKNTLTVTQNEMLDGFIEAETAKGGLDYVFQYS